MYYATFLLLKPYEFDSRQAMVAFPVSVSNEVGYFFRKAL